MVGKSELHARAQVGQLMRKLDEQLQLLRQATPLLRQRAAQLTDTQAAAVREQLAHVLDQQTDHFEESMTVTPQPCLSRTHIHTTPDRTGFQNACDTYLALMSPAHGHCHKRCMSLHLVLGGPARLRGAAVVAAGIARQPSKAAAPRR